MHTNQSRPGRVGLRSMLGALLLLTTVLGAAAARASVGPPLEIRLLGEPRAALSGQEFLGELELTAYADLEISYLQISGPGWTGLALEGGSDLILGKDTSRILGFRGRPGASFGTLKISCLIDGRGFTRELDLSAAHLRRMNEGGDLQLDPTSLTEPFPGVDRSLPVPDLPADRPVPEVREGEVKSVRVYGRFAYFRDDGTLIGADGAWVKIYDEDWLFDDLLGDGITNAQGYFDITVSTGKSDTDLYVLFELDNAVVHVQDPTWGIDYSWRTPTMDDYGGAEWNVGTRWPGEEPDYPAPHLATDIARTWRWANSYGYDTPEVAVDWPESGDGAWYTGGSQTIHITHDREWREDTHSHEYGHHFINMFAVSQTPDYCNEICDDNFPIDCGHCRWCEENEHDAWNEAFPNLFADVIPDTYAAVYGVAAAHTRDFESLGTCSEDGTYHDPEITEGYLSAVLVDIYDSNYGPGDNHPEYPDYYDLMTLDAEEILMVTTLDHPLTTYDFLYKFIDRYPGSAPGLWFTAMNCGLDCDRELPTAPYGLSSSSHPIGSDQPDPTVELSWTRGTDDASGVAGYGWRFTLGGPAMPDAVQDINNVDHMISPPLMPGTYYFTLRSVDNAGNWDDAYASYGPFTIHEAQPTNLTFNPRAGWDYPMVPSTDGDNSSSSCTVSEFLLSSELTYWNISGVNDGEVATATGPQARVMVDGNQKAWCSWGPISGGGSYIGTNLYPVLVRPGRHTFSGEMDFSDAIAESDETDNLWGHQFIWTPQLVPAEAPNLIMNDSVLQGGWDHIVDGSVRWYNCMGLRFSGSGWWNALAVAPYSQETDMDVRLHEASAGSEDGFAANLGWSGRSAGLLDAVIVNRNTMGAADWDVGVLNMTGGNRSFYAHHAVSELYYFPDSLSVDLPAGRHIMLREFQVPSGEEGPVQVDVWTEPPVAGLVVQWLDDGFNTGDLYDYTARDVTDASGHAQLATMALDVGYYCLVLYRDPFAITGPLELAIKVQRTCPDLQPGLLAGWHSPFVPLPEDTGTPSVVALPDTLHGDLPTWFNTAVGNMSPTTATDVYVHAQVDGQDEGYLHYTQILGESTSGYNWNGSRTIRSGRHTLAMLIDRGCLIEEMCETNNHFGEQYVWSPRILESGQQTVRPVPDPATGGWEQIQTAEPIWYNCDGLRAVDSGTWWQALAVMPTSETNVDIRLHPPLVGVKDGFGPNHKRSAWGIGQSDFLLVNYNVTPGGDHDVGVLRDSGSGSYTAQCLEEVYLGTSGEDFGPYQVASGQIMMLFEFRRPAGSYRFTVENTEGAVDWGLTVYPAGQSYLAKSEVLPDGGAWHNGPGQDETVTVTLPEDDYRTVAVWKVGAADLGLEGRFVLHIEDIASPADDGGDTPQLTRLAGVHPNPFNPVTTVSFELAAAARCRLAVYDLTGARVRRLLDEVRPAGRHAVVWDGKNDHGAQVASGVYMVRFEGDGVREITKTVLLK
jgi:hypothetical protein